MSVRLWGLRPLVCSSLLSLAHASHAAAWPMAQAVAASGGFFRPQSKLQEISTEKTLGACARLPDVRVSGDFSTLQKVKTWATHK